MWPCPTYLVRPQSVQFLCRMSHLWVVYLVFKLKTSINKNNYINRVLTIFVVENKALIHTVTEGSHTWLLCEAYGVGFDFVFPCNNHNNLSPNLEASHTGAGPSCYINIFPSWVFVICWNMLLLLLFWTDILLMIEEIPDQTYDIVTTSTYKKDRSECGNAWCYSLHRTRLKLFGRWNA